MTYLLQRFEDWNIDYFSSRLKTPHLTLGRTPPRSFSLCKPVTDWGAATQITINEAIVFGGHPIVAEEARWPDQGILRFAEDLMLKQMIRQFAYEVSGKIEEGYRGHGPHFAAHCNRIGEQLGLPEVTDRRRGPRDDDLETCVNWPHCVRPPRYYFPEILDIPRSSRRRKRPPHNETLVVMCEEIREMVVDGQHGQLLHYLNQIIEEIRAGKKKSAPQIWMQLRHPELHTGRRHV